MNTVTTERKADWPAYLWYPLVIVTALVSHTVLVNAGISLVYSTYLPVFLALISITLLEIYFPYRRQWLPAKADVINDAVFMVTVQVVLPQFLTFLVALLLVHETPLTVWPDKLPVAVQCVLMILIADFLRYWLHVACHNLLPLWQLHAVHHSPKKLYWLNVGRFHPFEKSLQFLFDTLPFIILGINEYVLAMYFVFYAVNGYFQHSNVHLKMGILNYLISSAELHRWHHSIHIHESNRNYGNNIIIWDLLFGTFFLPSGRDVGELGLKNRQYPLSFFQQMKTPFIMRLESVNLPLVTCREILLNCLLRIRFEYLFLTRHSYILNATRNPRKHQLKKLSEIIQSNRNSAFGIDHGFQSIGDYNDYSEHCPVSTFDELSPYIDTDDVNRCGLTREKPVFFQVTSGTSGKPKYLPLTKSGMKVLDIIQDLVALARYLDNPGTFSGKMFAVVSPAIEGFTGSGVPYGSASGLTYQNMPFLSRSKYVVPYEVFSLQDYNLKYLLIALYALAEPRVTIIATANPSTMLRILEIINQNADRLLYMLESGTVNIDSSGDNLSKELQGSFRADLQRANSLRLALQENGGLSYREIWPNLQVLVTWTGGSCGVALSSLRKYLPEDIKVSEMGYLSSEVHATVTVKYELGIPTFLSNFFEFVTVDDVENGRHNTLLLDELQEGNKYYVIVTTVNGLYRYFMNDIVQVTGFINRTPTLKFVQKGQGVTNITGEKLYEGQVLEAIKRLEQEYDINILFHQWLANEQECYYEVYIEPARHGPVVITDRLAETLDKSLNELNIEYREKRKSGRLKPLSVFLLNSGTGEVYKQQMLKGNRRDGQFKWLTLCYKQDSHFRFDQHITLRP